MSTVFAENRKARFDYNLEQSFECGIQLTGAEVRSIRLNRINISNAYVYIENNEVFATNIHIAKYSFAFKDTQKEYNETSKRKLLLHRSEINKINGALAKKGYTVIPVKCYQVGNKIKLQISLCLGKKDYDKREDIKKRDLEREVRKAKQEN